jgi:hypothetical protein
VNGPHLILVIVLQQGWVSRDARVRSLPERAMSPARNLRTERHYATYGGMAVSMASLASDKLSPATTQERKDSDG